LPFGTNNYTDLNPPAGDTLYYIEVVHAPCNPTFRFGNGGGGNTVFSSYNGAISNRFNTSMFFVGIGENEFSSGISLSPVPAENELFINSRNYPVKTAIITNALGQQVAEYNFADPQATGRIQIDVSAILPGVYSLQVSEGKGGSISKLFVKQ
jgi:hypothetical protein